MDYENLEVERRGSVFVLTMKKPPENRLTVKFCQTMIKAYHDIQRELGPDSEGAVILRGHDKKFFCTVSTLMTIEHRASTTHF